MNWYIGQEVACNVQREDLGLIKGKTYSVKGLMKTPCNCDFILLDVGLTAPWNMLQSCGKCFYLHHRVEELWTHEKYFYPILTNEQEEQMTELITEIIQQPHE